MPELPGQPKEGWPTTWVAAVIVICIIGYTFVTLEFRKVNPAYEPYHDLKDRGQTHQLLAAGYQRIAIPADQPTDSDAVTAMAVVTSGPGGVPAELQAVLFDTPPLPETFRNVQASARTNALLPYPIRFDCVQGDNHRQLGGAALYVHGQSMVIVPECEQLDGELLARRRDMPVRLTVPAGSIKPGRYQVSLIGAQTSLAWTLQVH